METFMGSVLHSKNPAEGVQSAVKIRPLATAQRAQNAALRRLMPLRERRFECSPPFHRLIRASAITPCSREDSNLHGLPHTVLSRTRLPVPPRELKKLAQGS